MEKNDKRPISQWAEDDRPREKLTLKGKAQIDVSKYFGTNKGMLMFEIVGKTEKLTLKGKAALSNAELIAILIASGNNKMSAVELAQSILTDVDNNLIELSKLGVDGLKRYKGIGAAKAISIIAALELGKRRNASIVLERKKIKSSRDAYDLFFPYLSDRYDEEFRVLLLDRANKVIQNEIIGEGGFSGTVADPKKIFKKALAVNA